MPLLSDTACRNAKPGEKPRPKPATGTEPTDKPYKLTDGGGLYLLVNLDGSKYWRWDYRHAGMGSAGKQNRSESASNGHFMGSFPANLWVSAQKAPRQ